MLFTSFLRSGPSAAAHQNKYRCLSQPIYYIIQRQVKSTGNFTFLQIPVFPEQIGQIIIEFAEIYDEFPAKDAYRHLIPNRIEADPVLLIKFVYDDPPVPEIDKPEFPHSGPGVLARFDVEVLAPGGRGQNLNDQIGRPLYPPSDQLLPFAYDQHIRLYHRPIIQVQADVGGCCAQDAFPLVGDNMITNE